MSEGRGNRHSARAVTMNLTDRHRCAFARSVRASRGFPGRYWLAVRRSDRLPSLARYSGRCRTTGRTRSAPSELYTTDHHNVADGLSGLPRDYAGVPRQAPPLGPPLPGDLGRPILNAQNAPSAADTGHRFRAATSRPGNRSSPLEPAVCIDQYSGGGILDCTSRFGRRLDDRAQPDEPAGAASSGRYLHSERPGSQTRLRQRVGRSPHHKPGSCRRASVTLCGAGGQYHSGVAYHRHPLGSAGPDHGSGHRKCLSTARPAVSFSFRRARG